ncbi:MAG: hypothetical protein WA123_01105, partial [Methylotenera sp.]
VAAAKRKLAQLESNQVATNSEQPDMFLVDSMPKEVELHPVVSELEIIQPDDLTPRQALEVLYKLKNMAANQV